MEESRKTTGRLRKLRRHGKDRNENVSAQKLGKKLPNLSLVVYISPLFCLQVTNQGSSVQVRISSMALLSS